MNQNSYINKLLEYLHDQNQKSLCELCETNPYIICDPADMTEWYQSLLSYIQAKPPDHWVRCLHIEENYQGSITGIWYDYYTEYSMKADISVMIHCEVVDEKTI